MKIGFTSIELPEGKMKYKDEKLQALIEKDKPKKISPFFAEFIRDEYVHSDVIAVHENKALDLLIVDMEKIDSRLDKISNPDEKKLLEKCMESLESETPLYDLNFTDEEDKILKELQLCSYKPVIKINENTDLNDIISQALDKAGYMFFYTTGPKESHAWLVNKNSDIVTCAGKIHSDLARGFIRGDVVTFENYMACHNFNECKTKGLARVVEKDYIVQPDEIIEIRFSV